MYPENTKTAIVPQLKIDLYSDTATQPTQGMREFMCAAEVGDEQRGEDPTTNALQEMVAQMLGKEAALLLPSGTMCNQIAFAVHCSPGDMILVDKSAHPLHSEGAGSGVIAAATIYPVEGQNGQYTADHVAEVMEPSTRYWPGIRLVAVEQTTNRPGGRVWPLEQMRSVCKAAHDRGASTHMDGARLLNAVVATGVAAGDYAESFDTLWIDLSKGLGAPIGGVLAGSADFILEAWRWKQRIGGAMRQSGIVAAAGIYALENNIDRLAEDHANAKRLAVGISDAPGISINPDEVETNMVRFDVAGTGILAKEFAEKLLNESGVRVSTPGRTAIRAIPHLGITSADVDEAAEAIRNLAQELS